jgi:hypothetical protein
MTPTILRQLWYVVETTQSNILLKLDDASLVQWLLKQTKTKASLDCNETDILSEYIHSRLTLIRELAQER